MEQKTKNIFNTFDEHGVLLGLERLRGEKNRDYKQRLMDVGVNRANSTYAGLINGLNRELGLTTYDTIEVLVSGVIAEGAVPAVFVDHASITLYEDYLTDAIDTEIEVYDKEKDNYAHKISDVVTAINASTNFSCTLADALRADDFSMTLIHQDSNVEVFDEIVLMSNRFFISNSDIITGTISFSEVDVFYNRVDDPDTSLMVAGDYFLDNATGELIVKNIPSGSGTISYTYRDVKAASPFTLVTSPVLIKDVNDDVFQNRMHDQFISPTGEEYGGLPKSEYVDIVREVLSKRGLYWGK